MTLVMIDMISRSPRDLFFMQPLCLETLLQHVVDCVTDVVDDPYFACFTDKPRPVGKACGELVDRLIECEQDELDPGFSWLEIGKRFVDLLGDTSFEEILYLNPLQGPLCRKRIKQIIAGGAGNRAVVSTVSMSINEHPLWVEQVPDKHAFKSSFVLKGYQVKGLRQNEAFVKALQNGKDVSIKGSQNLGDVYKVDGACVYYPAAVVENELNFNELVRHQWTKNGDTDIPWFYAVPIWSMARNTPVETNSWGGAR